MQDAHFEWRVCAAMLLQAQIVITDSTASAKARKFAKWVLMHPMQPDKSMMALVASDPSVVDDIVVTGETANTDSVPDADIQALVASQWDLVATKYDLPEPTTTP